MFSDQYARTRARASWGFSASSAARRNWLPRARPTVGRPARTPVRRSSEPPGLSQVVSPANNERTRWPARCAHEHGHWFRCIAIGRLLPRPASLLPKQSEKLPNPLSDFTGSSASSRATYQTIRAERARGEGTTGSRHT
jgi:hypothetical protein